jgi:F-type H+/Na+-transporting ATPase subunit alpha
VSVNEVRRFEKELLQFVETSQSSILQRITEKKVIDDSIKAEIRKAVEAFKQRFSASVQQAATAK